MTTTQINKKITAFLNDETKSKFFLVKQDGAGVIAIINTLGKSTSDFKKAICLAVAEANCWDDDLKTRIENVVDCDYLGLSFTVIATDCYEVCEEYTVILKKQVCY